MARLCRLDLLSGHREHLLDLEDVAGARVGARVQHHPGEPADPLIERAGDLDGRLGRLLPAQEQEAKAEHQVASQGLGQLDLAARHERVKQGVGRLLLHRPGEDKAEGHGRKGGHLERRLRVAHDGDQQVLRS